MNYQDKYARDLKYKELCVKAAEDAVKTFADAGAQTYWAEMALENAKNDLQAFKEWHRVNGKHEMLREQALAKLSSEELVALRLDE